MRSFQGKVAAITGAGSGIGQALAIKLAEQGCHLALSDINERSLAETKRLINSQYPQHQLKVTTQQLDVTDRVAMAAWAQQVQNDHGKVNLIFNNAGVALASTVEGASYADYEWVMDINFWGVVYGTKEFLPLLKQSGDGHIVNISSVFGLTAQPTQSAYNASKFAVRGFTESLRQELDSLKCGVSCTCIHPGGIRTNIANAARLNQSIQSLGINLDKTTQRFNWFLRTPPAEAADVILDAVRHDRRRALIGSDAKSLDLLQRAMPARYQAVLGKAMLGPMSWFNRPKKSKKAKRAS